MNWHGLQFDVSNIPPLNQNFWPMAAILRAHQKSARANGAKEIAIGIEKPDEQHSVYRMLIHSSSLFASCDQAIVERVVKFLLWMKGGYKIVLYGDEKLGDFLKVQYLPFGQRGFDAAFMTDVYGQKLVVRNRKLTEIAPEKTKTFTAGGNVTGCHVGLHVGLGTRNCAAVIDGKAEYSDEVRWDPAEHDDIQYIYRGVADSIREAAAYLPRVDSIGISARGIYVANQCRRSALFDKVPPVIFDQEGRDLFERAAAEFGAPVAVYGDGQVAALAGSMSIRENNVLGVAMGSTESAGYVTPHGHLNTWLSELGQAPVDLCPLAETDSWSGGRGVGSLYFSQQGAINLAKAAKITFPEGSKGPEKLEHLQKLLEKGHPGARQVFESIGMYWGHTVALYRHFYRMRHVLMLGRTLSGKGGEVILETARRVMREEYPDTERNVTLHLPDERTRRVGQTVAAAAL